MRRVFQHFLLELRRYHLCFKEKSKLASTVSFLQGFLEFGISSVPVKLTRSH
jgi:hypothetical protein